MAKNDKKQAHGNELLENPEVLAEQISKTEEILEENKTVVISVIGIIALIIAGYFAYNYYMQDQNEKAQSEMFQAIFYFEADSLDLALNGDGNNLGFKDIIENYSGSDAANLANFYSGTAYLKKGDFKSALLYLEDFSSSDLLVQARTYSLMGDAYMEQNDYTNAVKYYNMAADYKSNEFFTPHYLMKAAIAYEKMNDKQGAIKCYDKIINDFWKSAEALEAKKQKARLTAKAS